MKNSITHAYKRPDTYNINVTLNSFYDYSPHDDCIQSGASVVIKTGETKEPEIPENDITNDIKLSCKIDGKRVEVGNQNA